ncbi:hypothetical protein EJ065_3383 [Corallococcus coralloides]|uniref:Uncharacterized protein n=1 Tax=Corallococcus coralloides TaxID=184914 RepID=A0A410RST4_CORCK|nr:hypothetical protein [Corallococcus coralloides]QAT84945.1 hypothetical protein EJ065_3383 [Corallococcus coralloides]
MAAVHLHPGLDPDLESLWACTLVVSLMHFWYDGFIGSVARKQV